MNKILLILTGLFIFSTANACIENCDTPDLVVSSVSYENGLFSSVIKNQGTESTKSGVISVKYSVDGVMRAFGSFRGVLPVNGTAIVGTAYGSYTIPDGIHTVEAFVDNIKKITEAKEDNNTLSQSVNINPVATVLPDLVVTSSVYSAGIFTAVVKNVGTVDLPSSVIGVKFTLNGVERSTGTVTAALTAGASVTINSSPAFIAPDGTHSLITLVDGAGVITEDDETNNSLTNSFTITTVTPPPVSLPDAVVLSTTYTNGSFTSVVKNQGNAPIPSGLVIGVGYNVDGLPKTYGSVPGPLAAGASVTILQNGPAYVMPTGTHTILSIVDDVKRFAESNETNNTLTATITQGLIPTTPPPVVSITAPAANGIVSGNAVTLSANATPLFPKETADLTPFTMVVSGGNSHAPYTTPSTATGANWNTALPLSDQANASGWVLNNTYSDTFTSTTLDAAKWTNTNTGLGFNQGNDPTLLDPTTSGMDFYCRHGPTSGTYTYRCSWLGSKTPFLYGYIETSIKVAENYSNNNIFLYKKDPDPNPTLWTELDITEIYGLPTGAGNRHSMNAHLWVGPTITSHVSKQGQYILSSGQFKDEYHIFGMKWTPTRIEWYLDGVLVRGGPNASWHQPLRMYIGSWDSGGANAALSDALVASRKMTSKYVKVWNATIDPTQIAGVQFKIDGVNVGTEDTTEPYSISWDSGTKTNGTHTVTAVARDIAGNVTTSAARTITVANGVTRPNLVVTSTSYSGGIFNAVVQNTGSVATPTGTVIGVNFSVDGVSRSYGTVAGPLAAGASVTVSTTTPYTMTGTHSVLSEVDSLNLIIETDDADNTLTTSITVTPGTPVALGFAASYGVTGGAGGQSIVVQNCNGDSSTGSLRAAIKVNGARNITFNPALTNCIINWTELSGVTYVPYGNMTIDGKGANITITGMSLSVHTGSGAPVNNIIIRNLTFADTTPDRNAIVVDYGSSGVWIDNNTFYNNSRGTRGQPININHQGTTYDGLAPKGVTISWNYIKTPNAKAILVQSNNDTISTPMRVSIHHNRVEGIDARMPRIHGKDIVVHAWNNYLYAWKEYAMAANNSASLWAEYNYFENTSTTNKSALSYDYGVSGGVQTTTYWFANSVKSNNNYLGGTPTPTVVNYGTFPMSLITYSVTPETANATLKNLIVQKAGANKSGL